MIFVSRVRVKLHPKPQESTFENPLVNIAKSHEYLKQETWCIPTNHVKKKVSKKEGKHQHEVHEHYYD